MSEKLGQSQAFPTEQSNLSNGFDTLGMSKRFYAACAAMQGLLSNSNDTIIMLNPEQCVFIAFAHADEILKQENL